MKQIPLTKGFVALVDEEDFDFLNQWKWTYHSGGYAYRITKVNGKQKAVLMHRLLLGLDFGDPRQADHKNRNKLDNRRENLRVSTGAYNTANREKFRGSSPYKGVHYYKARDNWQAYIAINGKTRHLGYFKTPEEAAKAYNDAAKELHGDFAVLNKLPV